MIGPESALVSASAQLLEGLTSGRRPLSTVSASLADLAAMLGVSQVVVAIDDAEYGRQLFSSGRTPLGDHADLLWGPPRAWTDPPSPLDDALDRLLVAAVGAAFERARASEGVARLDRMVDRVVDRTVDRSADDLDRRLVAATDRNTRYGWGFTLVMLRLDRADDGTATRIETQLRSSDTLIEVGRREFAILLPEAAGDEVPGILARVGRHGAVSTLSYGLAACPGDATDAEALVALAASRRQEAEASRTEPAGAIHALEPPKV